MAKVIEFFKKWGRVVVLGIIGLIGLFTLGCTIYTSIINPFVGITGSVGAVSTLGVVGLYMYKEIKKALGKN